MKQLKGKCQQKKEHEDIGNKKKQQRSGAKFECVIYNEQAKEKKTP